jgi:hypothetical protein
VFNDPRYRCTLVLFFPFVLLRLDGQDGLDLPLLDRKRRLASSASDRTVCTMPHVERRGTDLFALATLAPTHFPAPRAPFPTKLRSPLQFIVRREEQDILSANLCSVLCARR